MKYDSIIVGAGFAGAVTARQLAEKGGKRVLVLEKRDSIGGNAYDCFDSAGVYIHKYGPHIFHTANDEVFNYLSRFTEWRSYDHEVVGKVGDKLIPIPFNLNSLYIAFDADKAKRLEDKLISAYGMEKKVTILDLRKSEDEEISELADYVYENVFLHYTMKQWGTAPEDIDPAVTARVPVFVSRDNRYFQDKYQGMPLEGYTAMFHNMLEYDNIDLRLGCDAAAALEFKDGKIYFEGSEFKGQVVYSGAVDELFGCCFGRLPYRTLHFKFETHDVEWYQTRGTVNYTVSEDFTRITEFKHMTGQTLPDRTTVLKEYPAAYTAAAGEIPYYAIAGEDNEKLYRKYADLAAEYKNLTLIGRLAQYRYYNMDAIVAEALKKSRELLG